MDAEATKRLFSSFYEMSRTCAEEVINRLKDEDQKQFLEKLEDAVRQVSEIENLTRSEARALDKIEADVNQSDDTEWGDLSELLEKKLAEDKNTVRWTGGINDFLDHVTRCKENLELGDMIVASTETHLDPYTKKPIEHPVRTKFCNHSFDKGPVLELLASKKRLRCPYMGCNKIFMAKDLVDMRSGNDFNDGEGEDEEEEDEDSEASE